MTEKGKEESKFVIGVDIGGTLTKIARISPKGKIINVCTLPTDGKYGVDAFINSILERMNELVSNAPRKTKVAGIGLAVAGFTNKDLTRMVFNPNIPWLQDYPLVETIKKHYSVPVILETDSNAAVLSEYLFGVGVGYRRFFVLTIGTGVGGGMMINGEILRISNECIGDVGHVIVDPGGLECPSGCKGCAEAVISTSGLEHLILELGQNYPSSSLQSLVQTGDYPNTRQIIEHAKKGDGLALEALHQTGYRLGILLASITPIFRPERIAIAGGISTAGSILLDSAKKSFYSLCGTAYSHNVDLKIAKLGWQSVLVGSACPILLSLDDA